MTDLEKKKEQIKKTEIFYQVYRKIGGLKCQNKKYQKLVRCHK